MPLPIIEIGHPTLRVRADELQKDELVTPEVQSFIDDLIATRAAANGAGIAANQVDNTWRIFVVEVADNPRYPYKPNYPLTVMVNPVVEFLTDDRYGSFEGCLSIPNLRGVVERCPHVRVTGLDRHGNGLDFEVKGISAATFQHELDHLDGILFPDRVRDPHTFCTWDQFKARHEADFRRTVEAVEARYNV